MIHNAQHLQLQAAAMAISPAYRASVREAIRDDWEKTCAEYFERAGVDPNAHRGEFSLREGD